MNSRDIPRLIYRSRRNDFAVVRYVYFQPVYFFNIDSCSASNRRCQITNIELVKLVCFVLEQQVIAHDMQQAKRPLRRLLTAVDDKGIAPGDYLYAEYLLNRFDIFIMKPAQALIQRTIIYFKSAFHSSIYHAAIVPQPLLTGPSTDRDIPATAPCS